jgi:3-methyladenine DNA glycosylase AlkD
LPGAEARRRRTFARVTSPRTAFITRELERLADPERAGPMAAYMKTTMPFLGVQAQHRRGLTREVKRRFPIADRADYEAAVAELWALPYREGKYMAIAVAQLAPAHVGPASLPLYERIIREGAWWDFVDEIAQHLVGAVVLAHPREAWPVMDAWLERLDDADMWFRRTAILCQNRHKQRTDADRLFRYCLARAGEREFFIRKAIGWALREYSYTAPDAVRDFLRRHGAALSGLSVREASKVLQRRDAG